MRPDVEALVDAVDLAVGAERALALDDAPVAFAAGDVGGPGDEVAGFEGFAGEVGGDALAELLDVAGHLVAVVAGQGPVPLAGV